MKVSKKILVCLATVAVMQNATAINQNTSPFFVNVTGNRQSTLAAPTNLRAESHGDEVVLSWDVPGTTSSSPGRNENLSHKQNVRKSNGLLSKREQRRLIADRISNEKKSRKSRPTIKMLRNNQAPEELLNGVAVTKTIAENEVQEFFIKIPADVTRLTFKTSNATGDPDLFVRFGLAPDIPNELYDFVSQNGSSVEELIVVNQTTNPPVQSGDWFITVLGFDQSTYTLTATYEQAQELPNGVPLTKSVEENEVQEFLIKVPADATLLTFKATNTTGDADLFVRFGSPPDIAEELYDFSSENGSSVEEFIVVNQATNPAIQTGDWFVTVFGFEHSTYTLTVTYAQLLRYNIYRSTSSDARTTGSIVGEASAHTATYTDTLSTLDSFFYQVTSVYAEGESFPSNEVSVVVTTVEDPSNSVPTEFVLHQNYPNPFNPETEISFELPVKRHVHLTIYNTIGQEIRTLTDRDFEAGHYSFRWDGKDDNGNSVTSGIYFYNLQADQFSQVKRMILLQ